MEMDYIKNYWPSEKQNAANMKAAMLGSDWIGFGGKEGPGYRIIGQTAPPYPEMTVAEGNTPTSVGREPGGDSMLATSSCEI